MLIAHLPMGYIIYKKFSPESNYFFLAIALFFSALPDIDLIYFYLFDRSEHHHKLFPHIPLFWICSFSIFFLLRNKFSKEFTLVFKIAVISVFIHLLLDTLVGYIWWLYPIVDKSFFLIEIPNKYNHWIINFIFHWTFIIELLIVTYAIFLFFRSYYSE